MAGGHPHPRPLRRLQVFEDTAGLRSGDPVEFTGDLLSVELGPGLLTQIYDGLQNPLPHLRRAVRLLPAARHLPAGAAARRGVGRSRPRRRPGDGVSAGDDAGHRARGHLRAPHHGAVRLHGDVHRARGRAGRRVHGRATSSPCSRTRAGGARDVTHDAALAGQDPDQRLRRAPAADRAAGHQGRASSTPSSPSPAAAPTAFPGPSAPARRCCSRSPAATPTWTS